MADIDRGQALIEVLLLHANLLTRTTWPAWSGCWKIAAIIFIGLPEAASDSAYDRPDTYVGPHGLSWIQRWAIETGVPVPDEPREAPWVARRFG